MTNLDKAINDALGMTDEREYAKQLKMKQNARLAKRKADWKAKYGK